jgi:hypothetical protein
MNEPFAYLSATQETHRKPLPLGALTVRYGVALWDGHRSAAEINAAYEQWLKLDAQAAAALGEQHDEHAK